MDDPAQRARALDLVQPYTALTHQHVATLFEAGEQRGSIYLVYEFISGEKLNAALAGQPMNLRRALDLASQLADALADAHALGLVHGALTASGVIVTPKGHAKILDFGLSACLPEGGGGELEKLQAADRQAARIEVIGRSRVAYAAPEQLLGQKPDHRADLFALGALLHEMVTGRHAFSGRTPLDIGVQVLQSRPPVPSALNAERPAGDRPDHREGAGEEAGRSLSGRRARRRRPSRRRRRAAEPRGRQRAHRARAEIAVAHGGRLASCCSPSRRSGSGGGRTRCARPGTGGSASRPNRCSSSCRSTCLPPTRRGPTSARGSPRNWPAGSRRCEGSPSCGGRRSARPRANRPNPRPWPPARGWRLRAPSSRTTTSGRRSRSKRG